MIVRTVLGDIDPGDLGVTYAHEHLIIDSPFVARELPHIHLPSVSQAAAEAGRCAGAGVGAMIDAMPIGSGGDPGKLAEVSRSTGLHIVASTGMHTIKYYEGVDWAAHDDADTLAGRFIEDIRTGVEGIRPGIMKVATTGADLTERETTLVSAAGVVQQATGIPILTHCEDGLAAVEQIEALQSAGVELGKVIVSHTDKVPDPGYHRAILETGANVEYDQALRQHLVGSTDTARLVAAMWSRGFGSQILLGTDGARRALWSTLGGAPGLAWLWSGFPGVLGRHGLGAREIETTFVSNPARILGFNPRP